ncbi:MAG: Type 11 methyltransferase [Candidatus Nomurabacteria bacterium GW2011_GWA2_43_15]|uniref:Arsenite methyltransferase n=2 Tax=Candidatus Nomuraibacteriota TaxID=1752729 RepID=A0A0G1DMX0_9BACT|nr:MAG: Type 11 methyltransferase [Candidatus Nomurabacteria bacterium GW2011_GWA2_43_15]KKT19368.1 MAG: Type 11 methyltransferase [Candidatus Nomurabacteria bacterium GW2011_GWB1_43_7]
MFGLKENDIVADLGAGTGFYSIPAGALVPRGKIYAVELQKDFLATIKSKVKEAHLGNVEVIWGNVEKIGGTKIGDSVADAVISSNILFQVEDKENFILEIKRILKPKGRVLLVDWSLSSIMGATAVIPKNKAREMFEKKGFIVEREINAGDHHYGMILIKS